MTAKNLDKKRKAFVDNYLQDFNATRAYKETYTNKTNTRVATVEASNLLTRPDIQQYLKEKLDERSQQLHIDTTYVVRKLHEIVEADFVLNTIHVTAEQLEKIPESIRKLIQSVKILKTKNISRDYENETEKYEVTFMSKDKAVELLGKHTGAFAKDNVQGQYDMGKMSFTEALKELDI